MARVVVAASVLALLAGGASSGANAAASRCARSVSSTPPGLPAPVRVATSCAVYTVFPSGSVRVSAPQPGDATGVSWTAMAGAGATVVQRGARIAVVRAGRVLFSSRGRFRAPGVFALVGPRAVAFSYESYDSGAAEALYVAPLGGQEREVARGELPLGWTRAGALVTTCASDARTCANDVLLRDSSGRLLRRLRGRPREVRFEPVSASLLALSPSGLLERYDGRWHRLRNLRTLGFGPAALFEPLAGGLIGVHEGTHVAVLRAGGSLFASARFHRRRGAFSVAGHSGLVANAAGSVVAFAVTVGDNGGGPGSESLYVLRGGERRAEKLSGAPIDFVICERGVRLAWHEDWLLYATPEGRTLVLDSSGRRRVDLTAFVRRIARRDGEGKISAELSWGRA